MVGDNRGMTLAGWASAEITPALPCWMGGYAARTIPADSIHDPLYARALALGTQDHPLVVIICDLLHVDTNLVHRMRTQGQKLHPGATFWLGATHTHSGPAIAWPSPHSGTQTEAAIVERIAQGALDAATTAIARMHPVRATWASGQTSGIATNRDHPGSGEDTALDLLCLYDLNADEQSGASERQQKPAAIIASFPCHPTILSAESHAISADLPGAFRQLLQALAGSETWVMLATGAAGDMSTRHTRQGQGISELERLGSLLALRAYELLTHAQPLTLGPPVVRHTTVELVMKELPAPDALLDYERTLISRMEVERQAGNTAQARTLETALQGIQALKRLPAVREQGERDAEVAVARLGKLELVAIPGELYNRLGVQIRHAANSHVLLLGYTNGYLGYLPTREAYAELDYEVLMSPFAPGAGEQLSEAAHELLAQTY
jgi:neutral ceramidase